ncbi:MAG: hypothetical protein ABII20_04975 [Candidatus Omnitrophota bacterium]|nr:hypothetical protein [Candidatus Omnitrophota bacterium]MBU2528316.1 hypothetical protein [bacterium]MBU3930039.1 hypothetical protein [bacterium]MBU4123380.1 hypothetical protein [bacterium]MDO9514433.1 hypothetical protein [Elusimicrobiota bacterium]
MIALEKLLTDLQKKLKDIRSVSSVWNECSFAEKYEIDEFAVNKKKLIVYVSSGIIKKDIEMNSETMLRELNGKLSSRKAVLTIEVKVRRR